MYHLFVPAIHTYMPYRAFSGSQILGSSQEASHALTPWPSALTALKKKKRKETLRQQMEQGWCSDVGCPCLAAIGTN